ncbi:retrovirus-related pol polyprotein from transposon TNT 1-94 [Tanacetum coccineum]|uniref:Retrovirus-related pol polyprotein from transposon TNT 1-94 n=1 Tax=Tanacetum coccineum TaxID=301880 RepID=A0ABQ5CZX4_9ASTR
MSELEKKVEALSKVDHSEAIEESVQANVINEVKDQLPKFLPKAVCDFVNPRIERTVRKVLQKTPAFLAQSSSTPFQHYTRVAESLSEYELKIILFDKMDRSRSYMTHDKHQELYDALLNSMCLDDAIASGEISPDKVLRKRHRDEDQDPLTGKTLPKTSKTAKSVTTEESVVEPVHEVAMDHRLKKDKITKADLKGPVFQLLKGTCRSSVELEYHLEQRYLGFSDKLDWANPEGDKCPFDLSKPLPLQGHPEHHSDTSSHSPLTMGNLPSAQLKQALRVQDEAYQERLFKSFQDEVKYEHVVPKVTSPQEGERLQDDEEMISIILIKRRLSKRQIRPLMRFGDHVIGIVGQQSSMKKGVEDVSNEGVKVRDDEEVTWEASMGESGNLVHEEMSGENIKDGIYYEGNKESINQTLSTPFVQPSETVKNRMEEKDMPYNELKYNLMRMLDIAGLKEIISSRNGMYLFKFTNEDDLHYVVDNGPWMVKNKTLVVQKKPMGVSGNGWVHNGFQYRTEICYRDSGKNTIGMKKVEVEYSCRPYVGKFCFVFGHDEKECSKRPKFVKEFVEREMKENKLKQQKEEFILVRKKEVGSKPIMQEQNQLKAYVTYKPVKNNNGRKTQKEESIEWNTNTFFYFKERWEQIGYNSEYNKEDGEILKEVYENKEDMVLMALADDEISMGNNHACNGEWINITMKKVNILPSIDEDSDWQTYLKYINIHLNDQIPNQKKKILGGEQHIESSSKNDGKENPFIPASLDYDHEMVPKSKDWVERLNPDSKLLIFNTGRILVPESHAVNECLQLTEAPTDPESSKESGSEPQTSEVMTLTYQDLRSVSGPVTVSDIEPVTSSVPTKVKINDQESKINELTKLVQMLMDEKINSTQMIQEPKFIIGGVLVESSQSSESSIGVSCTTYGSNVHSTTDHNDFEHFKRETHQEPLFGTWIVDSQEYDWCQDLSLHNNVSNQFLRQCLHLLHMDLFGPVIPMSINHEKYTLVIVDEYSRYTWVHFLKKKSHAAEMIMSFIRMLEYPVTLRIDQSLLKDMIRLPMRYSDKGFLISATFMYLDVLSFRVFNTRRQQIEETYHVTFDESMEAIRHAYKKYGCKFTTASASECRFANILSGIEPKKNKKDEHGIVTKNKARLVAQGYSQEERIDYDETFAPLARITSPVTKETQTHHSIEIPNEKPLSQEHQSPSPNKDQPESSYAEKTDESEFASSCSETLKHFDNYMPITERQLVSNLRNFFETLFAQVAEDNLDKHEEVVAFYVDLMAIVEGYYEENAGVDERAKLLKALNRVSETIKANSALKEAMKRWLNQPTLTLATSQKSLNLIRDYSRLLKATFKIPTGSDVVVVNATDILPSLPKVQAASLWQNFWIVLVPGSNGVESFEDQESLGVPEDASKQGRSIADIDVDVKVTLVDETQVRHNV